MKAILNVTDSRFQKRLLQQAKKSGKIEYEYEIPSHFQQNFPDINHLVINRFQTKGYGIPYPFGSDLTEDELVLEKALLYLKECTKLKLFMIIIAALFNFRGDKNYKKYLERMDLIKPKNINEFIYKKLIKYVLM